MLEAGFSIEDLRAPHMSKGAINERSSIFYVLKNESPFGNHVPKKNGLRIQGDDSDDAMGSETETEGLAGSRPRRSSSASVASAFRRPPSTADFGAAMGAATLVASAAPALPMNRPPSVAPAASSGGGSGSVAPEREAAPSASPPRSRTRTASNFGDISEAGSATKKSRRTASDVAEALATESLKSLHSKWGFEAHWRSRPRARDIETVVTKLNTAGRKAGSFLANDRLLSVSEKCFERAQALQARQELFDVWRGSFHELVAAPLSEKQLELLQEAKPETLRNMIMSQLHAVLDQVVRTPETVVRVVFKIWATGGDKGDEKMLGLRNVLDADTTLSNEDKASMVMKSQRNIALGLVDKIMKCSADAAQLQCFQAIAGQVASQPLPEAVENPSDATLLSNGWYIVPWADMECLACLAGGCENVLKHVGPGHDFQAQCAALVAKKQHISPRVKSHFRAAEGNMSAPRKAFNFIEEVGKQYDGSTQMARTLDAAELETWLNEFGKKMADTGFEAAYEQWCEFYENEDPCIALEDKLICSLSRTEFVSGMYFWSWHMFFRPSLCCSRFKAPSVDTVCQAVSLSEFSPKRCLLSCPAGPFPSRREVLSHFRCHGASVSRCLCL